ncbi:MAG: transposase [Gemmatimonadetes bacterium]|nr:transposase [Gemmatimonadota bacterium]
MHLDFIRPGHPGENCFIESFNGKPRDECPSQTTSPRRPKPDTAPSSGARRQHRAAAQQPGGTAPQRDAARPTPRRGTPNPDPPS